MLPAWPGAFSRHICVHVMDTCIDITPVPASKAGYTKADE
jgi:hypothetical protein